MLLPPVIVSGRPNGLPIATTAWPGCADAELPSVSGCNFDLATFTLITAMSVDASVPTAGDAVGVPVLPAPRAAVNAA